MNNNNDVIRYYPAKYRSSLEILRDVLELFCIRDKITKSNLRFTTNRINSEQIFDMLIKNKFIRSNRNDLPRHKRIPYVTYNLTERGYELLNKLKLLDKILPFERLHDIKRYD